MEQKSRTITFDVDAYTARLIGRENVSKLEGAVLEVVKNAYDADATFLVLYYSKVHNCIYIIDNGCGMTEDIIVNHWMTIGNSSKNNKFVSKGNRTQTGAKGIGRFALDRISERCKMLTISEEGGIEWIVNWEDFRINKKLSDVKAQIYNSDLGLLDFVNVDTWPNQNMASYIKSIYQRGTGTAFCLDGLRDDWDDKQMAHLKKQLENLVPPNVVNDFDIYFFDDQVGFDEAKIDSTNIDFYDYKINFQVKSNTLSIQILRNEFDFQGEDEKIIDEAGFDKVERKYFNGAPKCEEFSINAICGSPNLIGDYSGVLYFYKITQTANDRKRFYYKDTTGRKKLVNQYGGIKIYRDHFRVRPYGEYGDNDFDWLDLSVRKNHSPAGIGNMTGRWRVDSEQILGNVEISRKNKGLDDDADRQGIQDGKGFIQLKQILLFVIDEFERDRQSVCRKLAKYSKWNDNISQRVDAMEALARERQKWEINNKQDTDNQYVNQKAPTADPREVMHLLNDIQARDSNDVRDLQDENKMLQTLATSGIVTNMFMHEIRTLMNNIGQELDSAYEAIKYDQDVESAMNNISNAISLKKNFNSWFGITIGSIKKDKRKRKKYNLKRMLNDFINTWKDILTQNGIGFIYECDEDIDLYCFEFDIENIITNLISNSMASFDREMGEPLDTKAISLQIKALDKGFLMSYGDTGWGLLPKYKGHPERILDAFESGRAIQEDEDDGTGMGMWIVNTTVKEYNGSIDLSSNCDAKKGFCINIQLGGQ